MLKLVLFTTSFGFCVFDEWVLDQSKLKLWSYTSVWEVINHKWCLSQYRTSCDTEKICRGDFQRSRTFKFYKHNKDDHDLFNVLGYASIHLFIIYYLFLEEVLISCLENCLIFQCSQPYLLVLHLLLLFIIIIVIIHLSRFWKVLSYISFYAKLINSYLRFNNILLFS